MWGDLIYVSTSNGQDESHVNVPSPKAPSMIAVNKKTGKTVPDAVIIAKRVDMTPDGMTEMATKIDQVSSTEPGVYRFKANLSMEGGWQLSLGAKVQGETGTVENKLVITAQK